MSNLNLLFLAPHWRGSLIRAFRETRERLGLTGRLVGADSAPVASALAEMDTTHIIPEFDQADCIDRVTEICRDESIRTIIPLTNKAIEFLDRHRDRLSAGDWLRYLESGKTIEICHDKIELAKFFLFAEINHPPTAWTPTDARHLNLPIIAKKRFGEGSRDVRKIETADDLNRALQEMPDHIFQEWVGGQEYSIDWVSDGSGVPLMIVPRERLVVRDGQARVSRMSSDARLIPAGRSLGTRLGLRGPCNLQGILEPSGRFFFTDINLRFGAGVVHSIRAGADAPELIYNDLSGKKPEFLQDPVPPGQIVSGD